MRSDQPEGFTICEQVAGRDDGKLVWWRCDRCGDTGPTFLNDRAAARASTAEHQCPATPEVPPDMWREPC